MMGEVTNVQTVFAGIPIATLPRWQRTLFRVVFPRRWYWQSKRTGHVYVFRTPWEEAP